MKPGFVCAAALAVLLAGAGVAVAEDMFPNGCVSCHTESADGDMRLGPLLEQLGHKKIDKMVETVPGDCMECHSEDGGFGELYEYIHPAHFDDAATNKFVVGFEGKCTHCHAIGEDGEMPVKSGAKNW